MSQDYRLYYDSIEHLSICSSQVPKDYERHLFYTSDQASRNSYMTDEIPCNSGKSLLLQGILLLTHTGMGSEKEPQVTVSKSIRNSGFRALMSRWKATPFGELVHEFSDRTKEEDEDTLLSAAIEGMFLNTELFGHQRGASNKGYKKIKYGTMVLSTQNLHLGNAKAQAGTLRELHRRRH